VLEVPKLVFAADQSGTPALRPLPHTRTNTHHTTHGVATRKPDPTRNDRRHDLMMVAATADNIARARIVRGTGELLTINVPDSLIPIHLIVDPPGAARLVGLLSGYADKATSPE
jgi:hypothetical protein